MWEKKGNHEFGKIGKDKEHIVCRRKECFSPRLALGHHSVRAVRAAITE
jgi:hypothetical protein